MTPTLTSIMTIQSKSGPPTTTTTTGTTNTTKTRTYSPSDDYYFGKGKRKFRRPFRKGKGKGKSKFHRPSRKGKGKGDREALSLFSKDDKGKGKGSGKFGKSKGKDKYKSMDSTAVGKSSGMLGCSSCGSSNHNAGDCPWQPGQASSAHLAQLAAEEVPSSSSAATSSGQQQAARSNSVNFTIPARITIHQVCRTYFQQKLFDTARHSPLPAEPTSSQRSLISLMDIRLNPSDDPSPSPQGRADFFYMNMNTPRSSRYMMAVENDINTMSDEMPMQIYSCTVNGTPQLGLIYDPGAPDGISDADVPCKMRVAVTFKIAAHPVTLECNTIGGSGSTCPFLFPNSALSCNKSFTAHNFFENRDALLCLETNGTVLGIRMLLTDSGHHMIMHNDNRVYVPQASEEDPGQRAPT